MKRHEKIKELLKELKIYKEFLLNYKAIEEFQKKKKTR